jgi:hypothetical protein
MRTLCSLVRRFLIWTSAGNIPKPPFRRRPSSNRLVRHLKAERGSVGEDAQKMPKEELKDDN